MSKLTLSRPDSSFSWTIKLASSLSEMVVSIELNHSRCWFFMYCSIELVVRVYDW